MPVHSGINIAVFLIVFLSNCSAERADKHTEELFIKSMEHGHVLFHSQFTTTWNSSIADPSTFTHYRLFPKALGEVLLKYHVQELHLSQTQGLWQYQKWGYPPEDAAPGVELWVWFQPNVGNIEQTWSELVNALSGLFCASLNFMDSKSTVIPRWTFRPQGIASEYYSLDSRFLRYSAQPHEVVCTENLTPWIKLLPCESEAGIGSLFNGVKLYDASFHSLGIHVRPVCQDSDCLHQAMELKQTLSVVYDMTLSNSDGMQNWNFRSVFGRTLYGNCPLASLSKIYVDKTLHQSDSPYSLTLNPPGEEVVFRRGADNRVYDVYDVTSLPKGGRLFNLVAMYNRRVRYEEVTPPPLYAQRFVTGYGLEKGGISCIITNTLDTNLTVIYMETIPWFLRVYFSSVKIESYGIDIKPYQTYYIPGKDRLRSTQLELVFRLRAHSVTTVTMEFDRAFLKWTEYPPDANHGFYVNAAVLTTMLPVADQYTALSQNASMFGESMTDSSRKFFLRLHTESLLVSLPTPDFSMPYNVICLACTVVAIAFGSIHNLTTRSFTIIDPSNKKPNLLQKIKNRIQGIFKKKPVETEKGKGDAAKEKDADDKKDVLESDVKT